ncbi:hypothetical protein ACJD0Z_00770 [Flavobacteriaceae bacterium M23B6Z8]
MKKTKLNQLDFKKVTISNLSKEIKGGKNTVIVDLPFPVESVEYCPSLDEVTCADSVRICNA